MQTIPTLSMAVRQIANPDRERERAHNRAHYWRNREAILEKAAKRRAANRGALSTRTRDERYSRYGITIAQFDKMAAAQGGVCAICQKPPSDGKRLHVDHCHESGKVRGLLCQSCNCGLGRFKDSPQALLAAAAYLTEVK